MTSRILRWVLILPAGYVAWHVALFCGIVLLSLAERLCPKAQMVSGMCTAPWFPAVERGIFLFSSGLAGALIVSTAALVAPARKIAVAWLSCGLGALVALWMGISLKAWGEMASSLVAGVATARVLQVSARRAAAEERARQDC